MNRPAGDTPYQRRPRRGRADAMIMSRKSRRQRVEHETGFTLIELAIVIVVAGLLLVPLLRLAGSSIATTRLQATQGALETASEALIAFAAINGGCLPFAADTEGGLPDTNATGAAGNIDIGIRVSGADRNAGDLPWAALGLTNTFVDGDRLRIQYYVASPYTDKDAGLASIDCNAGYRGVEWDSAVDYLASGSNLIYVYYDPGAGRTLYEVKATMAAGLTPAAAGSSIANDIGNPLTSPLLQVRRGPDIIGGSVAEKAVVSDQNVFVLIAPGANRNADLDRLYVRDSTHVADGTGSLWQIQSNPGTIDGVIFSSESNVDATDTANNGDDTMLVMSFTRFKAEMSKYGLNMEAICDGTC